MSGAAQTARRLLQTPPVRTPKPARRPSVARTAQAAVPVSRPSDPAEREAAAVARRVVARPAAPARVAPPAQRVAPATTVSVPGTASSSGQPLPRALRHDMEQRFDADFSQVRVHTGDAAARTSRRLNAAAFTAGRDIFFARGGFQPGHPAGRELLAHELAHTVQQRGATQAPVQRSVDTTVRERVPATTVHRLGVQDALDYFAEQAAWIPGFTMLSFLLGFNPVNLRSVSRTPANLLRALIELLPGGPLITEALDNHGIVDRVATWAEGQLSALGDIGASIRESIDRFLDNLSWSDIFDLGGVWDRAKRIVTDPIDRIIAFGSGLVEGIITFIKDAILRPIAGLVEPTRGWPLLCAVLGFNPITGDACERSAATLLGGFMTLIGQDEVWQNIQRGNAVGQAWTWFQTAMSDLMGFVTEIPTLFVTAFRSLELVDIILVPRAFAKVATVFGGFAMRFVSWGLGTVIKLLEIIFSVVAPGAMGYLRRVGSAIEQIFRNPMGFVGNLVRAATTGFRRFAGNFLNHLMAGLLQWLTGALPGVYIPRALNLMEIAKFVLSVLGVTWQNIRVKLVRHVGEPAVRAMEMGFELLVTLVRDGPVAAWEQLREQLANLRQMAIDSIRDMIIGFVVERAIPRLVAMFIPGAGFIAAIVSIYGTITTMMNELQRIVQVVTAFLDSMMAIASGNITAAAARVEQVLARAIPLVISFVAGFLGLGNVAARVRALIERIRAPIDGAMDRVVTWIVRMAQRAGRFLANTARSAAARVMRWLGLRVPFQDPHGRSHSVYFAPNGDNELTVASRPRAVTDFLRGVELASPNQSGQVRAARGHLQQVNRMKRDPNLQEPAKSTQIEAATAALTNVLRLLSDDTDFHAPPCPPQRRLPPGIDVRNDLYINGSGYTRLSADMRVQGRRRVVQTLQALKHSASDDPYHQLVAAEELPSTQPPTYWRTLSDSAIENAIPTREFYDIDHDPPLANDWVLKGHDETDAERHDTAGNRVHLKLRLRSANRSAGATQTGRYTNHWWVGPNFSSVYNMSLRFSKKIKGAPFA